MTVLRTLLYINTFFCPLEDDPGQRDFYQVRMTVASNALRPLIFRTFADYRAWRKAHASSTVGFVPTMGALHAGHLSLARQAARENNLVVMSIFVNPAQFAPNEDLDRYPRTLDTDLEKIRSLRRHTDAPAGTDRDVVDVLLLPSAKELYPSGIEQDVSRQSGAFVSVLGLSHQLEGAVRPTFFRGVATVLAKFLNVVRPSVLYLGQKDVQQSVVVGRMMRDLCYDTELRVGRTVREADGLAMSSRNVYLSPEQRQRATVLYRSLRAVELAFESGERDGETLRRTARDLLAKTDGVEIEYVSVANREHLTELDTVPAQGTAIVSAAIRLGATRILDNIILNDRLTSGPD